MTLSDREGLETGVSIEKNFISVIIHRYKRAEFYESAVESVVNQTLDPNSFEIILVTDFYDRNLKKLSNKYKNFRFIIYQGTCLGERIRSALSISRGEILCFLDDDDEFNAEKLFHVMKLFSENKDVAYYHNGQQLIDSEGREIKLGGYLGRLHHKDSCYFYVRHDMKDKHYKIFSETRADFNSSSISVRRSHIERTLNWIDGISIKLDTFMFYSSLISNGDMVIDSRPFTRYRVHGNNVSINSDRDDAKSNTKFLHISEAYFSDTAIFLSMFREMSFDAKFLRKVIAERAMNNFFKTVLEDNGGRKPVSLSIYDVLKEWRVFASHELPVPFILAALITGLTYGMSPKIGVRAAMALFKIAWTA